MLNFLNQNSTFIVLMSVVTLFALNSVQRIRGVQSNLNKEKTTWKRNYLMFALNSHRLIIFGVIVVAFLIVIKLFAK